ncbi:MAG: hypothetical protein BWY76_02699 [bacterium ADurb.Bin429]|nr:MAG: hypothetical protein BWY76_02699 [bacterium ADurb.Bin429]
MLGVDLFRRQFQRGGDGVRQDDIVRHRRASGVGDLLFRLRWTREPAAVRLHQVLVNAGEFRLVPRHADTGVDLRLALLYLSADFLFAINEDLGVLERGDVDRPHEPVVHGDRVIEAEELGEVVDLAFGNRHEVRVSAHQSIGWRFAGGNLLLVFAGIYRGETDHHKGDEYQRHRGETGAHLAPAHVVQPKHERRADDARAVDIRPLHIAFFAPQHLDGLLEFASNHQRDNHRQQEDEETKKDDERLIYHLESRMEIPEQREHRDEDDAVSKQLLTDVGVAEHQFLEEEDKRHQNHQIPENANDRVRDLRADDRVIVNRVGERASRGIRRVYRVALLLEFQCFSQFFFCQIVRFQHLLVGHEVLVLFGQTHAVRAYHGCRGIEIREVEAGIRHRCGRPTRRKISFPCQLAVVGVRRIQRGNSRR